MRRLEHKKSSRKWQDRYMQMAALVATWSKHPSFQVGAVAVGDFGQILSTGYNGWPRGAVDEERGRQKTNDKGYSLSIHAEANLIYNTNLIGTSLLGSTVYVFPMFPCLECAKALSQVGVCEVIVSGPVGLGTLRQDWEDSWKVAREVFNETGVMVAQL